MYYGDELGMTDGRIAPDQVQDPAEKNQPGIGMGRDPERTPMLWDNSKNAGFTSGKPWLPIAPDFTARTVETEERAPDSMLSLYRALLTLRREHGALLSGEVYDVTPAGTEESPVLSYRRADGSERIQVLLNLGSVGRAEMCSRGQMLLSTDSSRALGRVSASVALGAGEGVVILLD